MVALVLFFSKVVVAASLEAQVNRQQLTLDQSLTLTIVADGVTGDLDLAPLSNDFEIIGTSQSREIKIVNGQTTDVQSWRIDLQPARVGDLLIPELSVNGFSTQPITVAVTEPDPSVTGAVDAEVFLEVEIDNPQPYVQAQIIYTIRFFSAVRIVDGKMSEPTGDALKSERLGDDTGYIETRDGRQYRVLERRYALFPQESGQFTIPPAELTVSVPADPNALGGFFGQTKVLRRRSEEIVVDVQPRPQAPDDAAATGWWIPARSLELKAEWEGDLQQVRVGEAITRVIQMRADGVSSEQLPILEPSQQAGLKIYADKPEISSEPVNNSLRAIRTDKWAVIPQTSGTLTLPAINVSWFDTVQNTYRLATVPEQVISVLPAIADAAQPATPSGSVSGNVGEVDGATMADGQAAPSQPGAIAQAGSDAIPEANQGPLAGPLSSPGQVAGFWRWLAVAALVGWGLTLLGLLLRRPKQVQAAATAVGSQAYKSVSIKPMKKALQDGDARSLASAVMAWAEAVWPHQPPKSLQTLASYSERGGDDKLAQKLRILDQLRYSDASPTQLTGELDTQLDDFRDIPSALQAMAKHWHQQSNVDLTGPQSSGHSDSQPVGRSGVRAGSSALPQL